MAQAQVINNPVQPSAITPEQQQVEVGPVLDVVPYVLSDGYTINLTLIPSFTQFNGYDLPPAIPGVTVDNVVQVPTILPAFYRAAGRHHGKYMGQPNGRSWWINFFASL